MPNYNPDFQKVFYETRTQVLEKPTGPELKSLVFLKSAIKALTTAFRLLIGAPVYAGGPTYTYHTYTRNPQKMGQTSAENASTAHTDTTWYLQKRQPY
jgi:uncharacterized short protein YbdD (DUF466 family)